MSDLKLYNGINNIDDDLIEEADCKQKPIIHHCYPIAASAAAVIIAIGAVGICRTASPSVKPYIPESDVIAEENTEKALTTSPATTEAVSHTSAAKSTSPNIQSTVSSTQTSVSYSKTSSIKTNSLPRTTAASAVTAQTEVIRTTVTGTVQTDSPPVQNYDFEYEGSIIMKKYAAALTALLAASGSLSPIQTQAEDSEPESASYASITKEFIEEMNIDLDLNSDGKIDIFDMYAFYRCEIGIVNAVPDDIKEKYNAIPKSRPDDTGETVIIDGMEFDENDYYLDFAGLNAYFFTYYGLKPEYFDPLFYLDNCPDTYADQLPTDLVKQTIKDIDKWNIYNFTRTSLYVKNENGSFRPFSEDDIERCYHYNEENESYVMDSNFYSNNTVSPAVYGFIRDFKSYSLPNIRVNDFMNTLINSETLDVDINSDGVYDFDDIVLIAHYMNTYIYEKTNDRDLFHYVWTHQGTSSYSENYPAELRESTARPISEEEWNKAGDFLETARYYFEDDFVIIRYLTENYLIENDVDPKYFDAYYYEKNHLAHYEYDTSTLKATGNDDGFFSYLGYLETFSYRNGPSAEKNRSMIEEAQKHEIFTVDEVNAAFPTYYRNVKTGVLPQPDIDLDGKTGISDYLLLDAIDRTYISICGYNSYDPFANRYPEVRAEINISKEARDNYKNNFDFNNNGISCDFLETECMRMYIFGELESQYENTDDLYAAINNYRKEHPEITYNRISSENMDEFNQKNGTAFTKAEDEEEVNNISESIEIIRSYSSFNQIYNVTDVTDGIKGDVNGDGNIDISDALLIMQYISNPSKYGVNGSDGCHITNEGYIRADVDGEGVTNMDALMIQKHLLGLCDIK